MESSGRAFELLQEVIEGMEPWATIKEKCIECPACQKECRFLQKYGTPKAIADPFNPAERGTSKKYTYYGFPEQCHTVLFPGCALAGTRPDKVMKVYQSIKESIPNLGIVLDCCNKPSVSGGGIGVLNIPWGDST